MNKSLVLSLDGQIIPIVTMEGIVAKVAGTEPASAKKLLKQIRELNAVKCLVLKANGKSFALMIDDASRSEETLVKPLPIYLQNCQCYSNVTVLGDGNAIMILDAEGIMHLMGVESTIKTALSQDIVDEIVETVKSTKQVIIFKCSGAEYFAIETGQVSRVESVDPKRIQEIGTNNYINIEDKTIRIIRPEDFAYVKKYEYTEQKLYMLTLKNSAAPLGLLVGKIYDRVESVFKLDNSSIYGDFVLGAGVLDEKVLIFLDYPAIVEEVEKDSRDNSASKTKAV
jgi:two-component system chemotaxis sensor kinase CheA